MSNVTKTATEQDWILEEPLFERFKKCSSLPALSPLPSKILKLCRNEETDSENLASLISQEPAIVARVLQVANSGFYGGSRHKVISIVQAVTLLGINTLVSLVTTFCLHRLLKDMYQSDSNGFDHVQFWRRSILASLAGRALAQRIQLPDTEIVYLGALLQDIGLLALNESLPGVVPSLTEEAAGCHSKLQLLEKARFGMDHAEMGSWLAELWELPEELLLAIRGSHEPKLITLPQEVVPIVSCVALSGWIAEIWARPDTEEAAQDAAEQANVLLNMTSQDLQTILTVVYEELPQIASFLQVKLGSSTEMNRVLQIAKETLLKVPSPRIQGINYISYKDE